MPVYETGATIELRYLVISPRNLRLSYLKIGLVKLIALLFLVYSSSTLSQVIFRYLVEHNKHNLLAPLERSPHEVIKSLLSDVTILPCQIDSEHGTVFLSQEPPDTGYYLLTSLITSSFALFRFFHFMISLNCLLPVPLHLPGVYPPREATSSLVLILMNFPIVCCFVRLTLFGLEHSILAPLHPSFLCCYHINYLLISAVNRCASSAAVTSSSSARIR
jgi:hypothetical protein